MIRGCMYRCTIYCIYHQYSLIWANSDQFPKRRMTTLGSVMDWIWKQYSLMYLLRFSPEIKRKFCLLLSWSVFLKNNQLCFFNEYRVTYPLYTRFFIKLQNWHIPSYPTALTLIFLRKIAWKTREKGYHNMVYGALFIQRALYRIHYCDVRMCVVASQITSLTIVYSSVYSDADKKTIKALRHWPLCGEFTGDRWVPRTNGQ